MTGIRRLFFLFFTLLLGILLGNFGIKIAIIIVVPLFLVLLMSWDEKRYYYAHQKHKSHDAYSK